MNIKNPKYKFLLWDKWERENATRVTLEQIVLGAARFIEVGPDMEQVLKQQRSTQRIYTFEKKKRHYRAKNNKRNQAIEYYRERFRHTGVEKDLEKLKKLNHRNEKNQSRASDKPAND